MKLLEFLETIDFIDNKERIMLDLLNENIEHPNIIDICTVACYSTLEFFDDLSNITVPKKYTSMVKEQIKLIINDWNSYSDSINIYDYITINDDMTEIYREFTLETEHGIEDIFQKFKIKYES